MLDCKNSNWLGLDRDMVEELFWSLISVEPLIETDEWPVLIRKEATLPFRLTTLLYFMLITLR